MKKIRIRVTAADIRNGQPLACMSCPVALAIARRTGYRVTVTGAVAILNKPKAGLLSADLPLRVRIFIDAFDEGSEVEPFDFDLAFPHRLHAQALIVLVRRYIWVEHDVSRSTSPSFGPCSITGESKGPP